MGRDIVALDDVTVNNIGTFKKINSVCLPTTYPDKWYQESLDPQFILLLVYYTELPVGAIKAKTINTSHKLTTHKASQQNQVNSKIIPNAVYIESLAVLPAYRKLGLASKLLTYVLEETKKKFIHQVVLHVHVDNKDAIDWYEKKGFVKGETVDDYYSEQGLENPHAVILSIEI